MVFNRLSKDSAAYGGADFLTKALSFFIFPVIATALSPEAFGSLEMIFTVTGLLGLIMNCGLNNSVQRFYWDKDTTAEHQRSIVTSGLVAQILFGCTAVLVGLVFIPFSLPFIEKWGWPVTGVALVAALLVMALSQWVQYILDVIRLHFSPWRFFLLALTSRAISLVFGLIAVVALALGVDGLLSAQALVLLLVMPWAIWLIRKDLRLASFDRTWFRELVHFGYPFIFAGLAYWIFGSMDRWMLASMTSIEEVGIYSVAFRFASVVLFVAAAFGQAWSPVAIKIRTDHPEKYRQIYGQVLLLLVFVMLTVGGGVALFAGEIVYLIMPREYLPSALPLAILSFGILLQATQQVTAVGISLERKTYLFARLAWITALVNLVANWLLIPNFGAAGAAWATLIAYVVLTINYMLYTQRLHPLVVQWRRLGILIALGIIVASVSFTMCADNFEWSTVLTKLTIAVVCVALGWRLLPINSFKSI